MLYLAGAGVEDLAEVGFPHGTMQIGTRLQDDDDDDDDDWYHGTILHVHWYHGTKLQGSLGREGELCLIMGPTSGESTL
jgi:hypothetical protein